MESPLGAITLAADLSGTLVYLGFGERDPRHRLLEALDPEAAGLALEADIFVAAVGGILAPLILERMGRDPAVSSSIIVTFLTDLMGFFAVLAIAALILL